MALKFSRLMKIDGEREIRKNEDFDSWYHLELGLLLALKESGTLNAMQYRIAEDALREQRLERAGRLKRGEQE